MSALWLFAMVGAAYAVGAEMSWQSFSSGAAFGFPPAGVTVAALLLTARRSWPVVISAIVVSEVCVDLQHHLTLAAALASAVANSVEPVVGASCARRFCGGVPKLTVRADLLSFVAGAVLLGPLAGGLIGASVITVNDGGWWPGLVLQWCAGDGIAVLVVGAPILLWVQRRQLMLSRWRELALIVAVTVALAWVAFRFSEPSAVLFLPLLAWAAFWIGDVGVVLAGTAFAIVANYLTAAGYGEFTNLGISAPASLVVTQVYIATIVIICWLLAQEVTGRIRAIEDRERARMQREAADARRMAAELGDSLADTATVGQVAALVSDAVRGRLGAAEVTIDLGPAAAGGPDSDHVRQRGGSGLASSAAALPLMSGARTLGHLAVRWPDPHQATAVERDYLQAVADTTSRALERARLRAAERRERDRIETLATLTRLLGRALTPEAIGDVVSDRVRTAVGGADALSLGVVNPERTKLEWTTVVGYADEIRDHLADVPMTERTAATDAIRTGQPVIIRNPGEYARQYPGPGAQVLTLARESSWLAWPLSVGKGAVGSIVLMWKTPQEFGPGQLAFVAAVADLVAHALVRARVYADEHAIATVLQRAVMPKVTAPIDGLEIGTCYRQAGTSWVIGGDWYDALALPGGGAYLAVGDVAGHGISAAEDMTQIRNAGRALAIAGYRPARLLTELTRITAAVTKGQFATMAVALLEPDASRITYASAGHLPLLVRRARTGQVETLHAAGGPPLGPFDDAVYTERRTRFQPGDITLMYTDGLIERRGEDIGDGIRQVVGALRAWPADGPLEALCQHLVTSLADGPQPDDICVLAVRRRDDQRRAGGAADQF